MRPLRGSSLSAFQPGVPDPLPSVFESNSAFQLQEYIALLIRADVHDVDRIVSVPTPGPNVPETDKDIDEGCWVYEHLRRLAQDLTHPLITTLQQECTRKSCPEMKAGEWLYLCVAHGGGGTTEVCISIISLSGSCTDANSSAARLTISFTHSTLQRAYSTARALSPAGYRFPRHPTDTSPLLLVACRASLLMPISTTARPSNRARYALTRVTRVSRSAQLTVRLTGRDVALRPLPRPQPKVRTRPARVPRHSHT